MSVDYSKLKTNLNLIMHRLKLVEKKKMELNQKARKTIGDFLNAGKVDRARIRVEQIIREDYQVEAMDLVESYCDLLLSRFGQIQATETVNDDLATAISSLLWVTPYFETDVTELKVIADQLGKKYGKQYVIASRENQLKTVNEILIKKMSVQVPPKVLVEKYLVEIAKDQKIDYKPDPRVLKEQEALSSSSLRPGVSSDDEESDNRRQSNQQPPQGGFNLIDLGDHYPVNPITQPFNPYGQAPPLPSEPPLGLSQIGPANSMTSVSDASAPINQVPIGFNLPDLDLSTSSSNRLSNSTEKGSLSKKELDEMANSQSASNSNPNSEGPPPNYESVVNKPGNTSQYYSFGPESSFAPQHRSSDELNDTLPELPPVPKDVNDGPSKADAPEDPLDFEDLTRRFEELKNRKN